MDLKIKMVMLSMTLFAMGLFSGCGGGSGGSGTGPAAAKMVTGVAATGSPIVGTVSLKDSSPVSTQLTTSTASDGSFAFNTAGLTPPFIIRANTGTTKLYSLATDYGIVNITPLTTMALSQAAGGADLESLYNNHNQSDINAAAGKMADAAKTVQKCLAPLMNSFGVTTDILNGQFSANHTGMDSLLDAISVSVTAGTVNIVVKQNGSVIFTAPATNLAMGSVNFGDMPTMAVQTSASAGNNLYTANCAGCHGDLANSNLKGRASLSAVQGAIGSNRGGMGMLSGLSASDIQTIIDLISGASSTSVGTTAPTSSGTAASPDGAALYASNCAGCHGALATSSKKGATVVRLQNAVSGNVGGMGFLSKLTASDIQAIVTALNPAGSTTAPVPAPSTGSAPSTNPTPDGAALYAANCAVCHGALASSSKKGITIARLQSALTGNIGGMNYLSTLTAAELQAIVTALTPATPALTPTPVPDGAALYAANCFGCHGALASSSKKGITIARLQTAIAGNTGGMGALSHLTVSEVQAIVTALTPATPTPTPVSSPTPSTDGPTLYTANCAGCHGALASSAKAGATVSRIQGAISANTGGMGYLSSLTSAQITAISGALATIAQTTSPTPACGSCHAIPPGTGKHSTHRSEGVSCATCHGSGYSPTTFNATTHNNGVYNVATNIGWNASSRSCSNSCHGTHTWSSAPTPVSTPTPVSSPTPSTDGPTLYTANCAGCHGALASSAKAGATVSRIQGAISANTGGMGYLSPLTSAQITAISGALATIAQTTSPTPACGSCHAIPPGTGKHSTHRSEGVSCATCHGSGYSPTTFNATTHNNGVYNVATNIGWNASSRSCSNSCHGTHTWSSAPTPVSTPTPVSSPTPTETTTDGETHYTNTDSDSKH